MTSFAHHPLDLTANDVENFEASFITPDMVHAGGIHRVNDDDGAAIVGRRSRNGSCYSGIVYPYYLPLAPTHPRGYRLRRDHPDLETKNGETKEKGKYLSPRGAANMIYFPPACDPRWLADLELPIVITEGEKKAIALNRVARHGLADATEKPRFLVLGLSGVWNFRGTVGKISGASGQLQDVKGLIKDFELLDLRRRSLTILFDANAETNDGVRAAGNALAKEMQDSGARVAFVNCPLISGCNGIDDVLGHWEREHSADYAIDKFLDLLANRTGPKVAKQKQSDVILGLADDLVFFHTPEKEAFATIESNGHAEHHRIRSSAFRQWWSHQYYKQEGRSPSSQALQDALSTLCGRALFEGSTYEVRVRLAAREGKIYLDLCDADWRHVEIDGDGWRIVESRIAPVKFRRTRGMLALPDPVGSGSLQKLGSYLNLTKQNLILVVVWLLHCLRPDFPFPILVLSGEQGTAKSTAVKLLRSLVDPSITPFRSSPRHEHDLVIAASNGWLVSLDNLSSVPDWLSDALCRLSTGGGFATRTLYSDDDETIFNAKRPIVINGIGDLSSRSDLLDRALLVKLEPIPKESRRTESELWNQFDADRPEIFAALLTALSAALQELDSVVLAGLPRMADFARFGAAAERGLGLEIGAFI
jgi:hypothetical protein